MKVAPLVSIIIPCRNEEGFIGQCLDSILLNDYPRDRLEVIVVDGMSTDKTREIVEAYVARYDFIRLVDNPKKVTPAALNIGIREARGDLIMRMDAHATYDRGYISACVRAFEEFNPENVGGITLSRPRTSGRLADAIAATFNHRLGAGNARYRTGARGPKWVDTVFGGCYRRDVFEKVGLFNEALIRHQDYEFNVRLRKAGGKTLLVPDAVAHYCIRSDLPSFARQNWLNGVWVVLSLVYSDVLPVSWRHLVPLAFIASLGIGVGLGLVSGLWHPLGLLVGAYLVAVMSASFHLAWRTRDLSKALLVPVALACLHLPYGAGSLWGVAKALWLVATGRARRGKPRGWAPAERPPGVDTESAPPSRLL